MAITHKRRNSQVEGNETTEVMEETKMEKKTIRKPKSFTKSKKKPIEKEEVIEKEEILEDIEDEDIDLSEEDVESEVELDEEEITEEELSEDEDDSEDDEDIEDDSEEDIDLDEEENTEEDDEIDLEEESSEDDSEEDVTPKKKKSSANSSKKSSTKKEEPSKKTKPVTKIVTSKYTPVESDGRFYDPDVSEIDDSIKYISKVNTLKSLKEAILEDDEINNMLNRMGVTNSREEVAFLDRLLNVYNIAILKCVGKYGNAFPLLSGSIGVTPVEGVCRPKVKNSPMTFDSYKTPHLKFNLFDVQYHKEVGFVKKLKGTSVSEMSSKGNKIDDNTFEVIEDSTFYKKGDIVNIFDGTVSKNKKTAKKTTKKVKK